MPTAFSPLAFRYSPVIALAGLVALAGCGVSSNELASSIPAAVPGRTIHGNVHGGVYPIRNANITLMQTQTGPYASPGYTGTSNYGSAAKVLLTTKSDGNGYFTFPDTGWICASNEFAYIVVTSGTTANLGTTAMNNDVVQVGVIGPCSELATTAEIDEINVFVSELSTVAAAYALGNFMQVVDPNDGTGDQVVNIGAPLKNSIQSSCVSGSTCTAAGLAHAFANAANLVNSVNTNGVFPTGQANSYNPASPVSAVPAAIINTIGNILQQCVDSIAGTQCPSLFSAATPPNGAAAPVDTLEVALDMAKFPTNNITNLFNLQAPAVPFTPTLNAAPTSFTVSFFYGATASGSYTPYPVDLALDANDSVYVLYSATSNLFAGDATGTYNTYAAVAALSANGSQLFYGAQNTSLLYPSQIAVSSTGRVYVTNDDTFIPSNGGLFAASAGSGTLSRVVTLANASGVAVDRSDNVWVSAANTLAPSITQFPGGASTPGIVSQALGFPVVGLGIDASQNVWGVGGGGPLLNASGVVTATVSASIATLPSGSSTAIAQPVNTYNAFGLGINSAGTAFVPIMDQLNSAIFSSSQLSVWGNPTLSATNPVSAPNVAAAPHRTEVDGAGNVFWTDNEYSGLLYMYAPSSSGNTGSLISLMPCFPYPTAGGLQCITTNNSNSVYTPTNLRALAIDSAGDVWYAADADYGTVIETLGLAAPTWPQLSYGHPGCKPGTIPATAACP